MGSIDVKSIIYDVKLSSVVPATMTGENVVHELSNMDLLMKLHYIKGVYYFDRSAVQGLTISDFKSPMFTWLELYYITCGRIRKSESGRPFVKCNDGGVRIIEAKCSMTLNECLDEKDSSVHNQLLPNQVLGPELAYSPLVLIQFTWFKCGGVSVGLSWAHVLGDAFSASDFINTWGQVMAGKHPPKSLNHPKEHSKTVTPSTVTELLSVKKIEAVKDSWIARNTCGMETFSFQLTATQLKHLQSQICNTSETGQVPVFETLCAVIWHSLAKIRGDSESRIITTCRNGIQDREDGTLGNYQTIGVVIAELSIVETEASALAALIVKQLADESNMIEDTMARDEGSDFIVYGANLTFVDLEDANLYGLKFKGQEPVFTNYYIDGAGKEGVVLVLPGPEAAQGSDSRGRTVTVVLPENEVMELRNKLKEEWSIV
ncbi:hypothetical protein AQUCO_00700509v1 [Aquilegia coerulea]|uniref:Uncharacterized protein n=1 Tax=Aquilegia coerulea TaxID=218851 RepID=A0A2G5EKF2_AQUCA|nr:hypothetical protein AQUCO_00700509v1 [Aquilegia coerulea]